MDIRLDDEVKRLRQRNKLEEKISATHLFFLILFAVYMALMLAWASQRFIDNSIARYQLEQLNKELAIQKKISDARLEEQKRINTINSEKKKLEEQKRSAGYRQAMETCLFWKQQYNQNPSPLNQTHRDNACALVNQFK
jgi:vancomycin resistance protein YoaR